MIITIDGPTASGKSTIAELLAKELHYYFISTGILFRSLAYLLLKDGYPIDQLSYLSAAITNKYFDKNFTYSYSAATGAQVIYKNINLTPYLKTPEIDTASSLLGLNANAREAIVSLLHIISHNYNCVVEGRDTGSVSFANADIKFFLTASEHERADRWQHDQKKKGNIFTLEQALQEIKERDYRDQHRNVAPLIIPDNAVIIDSTGCDKQQILAAMIIEIKKRKKMGE